jgi:hypothetical protein
VEARRQKAEGGRRKRKAEGGSGRQKAEGRRQIFHFPIIIFHLPLADPVLNE